MLMLHIYFGLSGAYLVALGPLHRCRSSREKVSGHVGHCFLTLATVSFFSIASLCDLVITTTGGGIKSRR